MPQHTAPTRCLTLDIEDYYHIEAARGHVDRRRWPDLPPRVQANTDRLLALLARRRVRATMFILGDVAKRHPDLVRRCAAAGHEIASHGHAHDRLHRLSPDAFRRDVERSKKRLEDLTGQRVLGYRAPTWSMTADTARFAVPILAELGFAYDASVYPIAHPHYGIPGAPTQPFYWQAPACRMLEVPTLTLRLLGRNLPVGGGGYLRLLPPMLIRMGLRRAAAEGRPAILYLHPWEIDPATPRLPLPPLQRLRTYLGLSRTESRLSALLDLPGSWQPIAHHLPAFRATATHRPGLALAASPDKPTVQARPAPRRRAA